jgi:cobalamin biosynthesis protein CbiG
VKYLGYKNRVKAAWAVLFKPTEVRGKFLQELSRVRKESEQRCTDKLAMIENDQYNNFIVRPEQSKSIPVLQIPMQVESRDPSFGEMQLRTIPLEERSTVIERAFENSYLSVEELKAIASGNLAKQLVKERLMDVVVDGRWVKFYIKIAK